MIEAIKIRTAQASIWFWQSAFRRHSLLALLSILLLVLLGVVTSPFAAPAGKGTARLVILHTNDIQSRLLGYGPNSEYSPTVLGNDSTIGGMARLVTLVKQRRAALESEGKQVLLLDGGDITMGTLFHTVTRETGGELRLLALAGYDAAAVGNHELDFYPEGLAQMINSALRKDPRIPTLLMSNLAFDPKDPGDDGLELLASKGAIRRYVVITKGDFKIGVFGILGKDGFESTKTAAPLQFMDPIATAKEMVKLLRETEKVDAVVVCSHSGVREDSDDPWQGEDVELAKVEGIDAVIGGHSHTIIEKPRLINGRVPVMQAGSELRVLGEVELELAPGTPTKFVSYKQHKIDDSILGDPQAIAITKELQAEVTRRILSKHGLAFEQILAESSRNLTRAQNDHILGNIVSDSIRLAAGTDIGVTSNGLIRDDVTTGRTGLQRVSDIFRLVPLGVGEVDGLPGNTVARVYLNGRDLKSLLEVLSFAYQIKGESYYPRVSGLRSYANPLRMPMDRIYKVEILSDNAAPREVDLKDDKQLYSLAATTYVMKFMYVVKQLSFGLHEVHPKDAKGQPLTSVKDMVIDARPDQPGVQEIKEWAAIVARVRSFKDTNGNGVPDFPTDGEIARPRMVTQYAVLSLFKQASYTYLYLILLLPIGFWLYRRQRRVPKS